MASKEVNACSQKMEKDAEKISWLMSTLGGNLYSKSEWPKEK
jgi:hypothetical protein